MKRYVILHHVMPAPSERPSHWDFMLQSDQVLRTWAFDQPPEPGKVIVAAALADHRIDYLTYEGPVSGDRGHVKQWDQGTYTVREDQGDCLRLLLTGERLECEVTITRDREDSTRWFFRFASVSTSASG
jgi:hypothetical protein